jgi:1-acyl-sn-glycerol-3-phosphate acyltransferase
MRFYMAVRRFLCIVVPVLWRVKIFGRENIPKGAAIVCGNHTAITDPVYAIIAFNNRDPLYILIKKEILSWFFVGWALKNMRAIPVDREMNDIKAVKLAMSRLKENHKLLLFPEGTRARNGETLEPKSGAAVFAHRCNAPIVPFFVTRGKKPFFSRVHVVFGEPYYITSEQKRPSSAFYEEESRKIMQKIFALDPEV